MKRRKDEMAGQCGMDRYICRFTVPDLTDHDNVRVLPQNRPQPAFKRHAGARVDLRLREAFERIFNRVLYRNDILLYRIDKIENCVQCRGLSASGRALWKG